MSKVLKMLPIFLVLPIVVFGATYGSRAMLHLQTASTLRPGKLNMRSQLAFYSKAVDHFNEAKSQDDFTDFWDVNGDILLSYGFTRNLDMTAMLRLYKDVHKGFASQAARADRRRGRCRPQKPQSYFLPFRVLQAGRRYGRLAHRGA